MKTNLNLVAAATTTVTIQDNYCKLVPPFNSGLAVRREGEVKILTWTGGGQLQRADRVEGPWQTLTAAQSPCAVRSRVPATFYKVRHPRPLPKHGVVAVNGQTVRFIRAGVIEEYRVSLDGVRQDFIVLEQPPLTPSLSPSDGERVAGRPGEGMLRLELTVSGASVEPAAFGAQLVLENSGRKIAYSRLRVTDATGKESPARMGVP